MDKERQLYIQLEYMDKERQPYIQLEYMDKERQLYIQVFFKILTRSFGELDLPILIKMTGSTSRRRIKWQLGFLGSI